MNILLIEDENAAALRLKKLVEELIPNASILGIFETVSDAREWFESNDHPDLIISDIQLADGVSFDIFTGMDIRSPVIFTTAYDGYMLKAFKVNSIDYLLKPIDKEELKAAILKYQRLHENRNTDSTQENLLNMIRKFSSGYKSRFLVKKADSMIAIPVEEIAYLKAEDKIVFLFTRKNQRYIIDESLDELEKQLDPSRFFRLNRQYISPIDTIDKILNHFNGKLRIILKNVDAQDIFVSREKATEFKQWLNM